METYMKDKCSKAWKMDGETISINQAKDIPAILLTIR